MKTYSHIVFLFLCLSYLSYAEDDEISPETLPDELPNSTSFVENPSRSITTEIPPPEKASQPTSELNQEDRNLERPDVPLLPPEPDTVKSPNIKTLKAQADAELALPDPNYIAPPRSEPAPQKPKPETLTPHFKTKLKFQPSPKKSFTEAQAESQEAIELKEDKAETLENSISEEKKKECKIPEDSNQTILCSSPNWSPPKIPTYIPMVLSSRVMAEITADPSHPIPYQTYILRLPVPNSAPNRPPKGVSDVSIILSNNEFYPSQIILKSGSSFRLLFTTTNRKSAALVIEKLNIQRWVASQFEGEKKTELDRSTFEVNRELSFNRVTEVSFSPKPGKYSFHDVITGASGEILVEE